MHQNGWLWRRQDLSSDPPVWFTLTGEGDGALEAWHLSGDIREEQWPFEDIGDWNDRLKTYLSITNWALRCAQTAAGKPDHESHAYPYPQKDYDKGWSNRLQKVTAYTEAGHRTIPELQARLRYWWTSDRWKVGELIKFVVDGKVVALRACGGYRATDRPLQILSFRLPSRTLTAYSTLGRATAS